MSNSVSTGQVVSVHYTGTFDNGEQFDSSHDREALTFQVGGGQMISGFDAAVVGMSVGETKNITLSPTEAYGETLPQLVQQVPLEQFPEGFQFEVGATVQGEAENGQPVFASIVDVLDDSIVLDFNHPLAGKSLNFEIELLTVGDTPTTQE